MGHNEGGSRSESDALLITKVFNLMEKNGFYTSGTFAKKAHVTKKTLRYYNEHGFLKPSCVSESGINLYSEKDFEKIQRILLLKYLGFSLEDIKNTEPEKESFMESLEQQMKLLEEKIKQMNLVKEIFKSTMEEVRRNGKADWTELLQQVTETGLKESLLQQYVDTSNISVRIRLHKLYSQNKEKWFPWIYGQCNIKEGDTVLEIGCGNGSFWLENMERIPKDVKIILSDNSKGVMDEIAQSFPPEDKRFAFFLSKEARSSFITLPYPPSGAFSGSNSSVDTKISRSGYSFFISKVTVFTNPVA